MREFNSFSIKYTMYFWFFQIVPIHAKRASNKTIAESEVDEDTSKFLFYKW